MGPPPPVCGWRVVYGGSLATDLRSAGKEHRETIEPREDGSAADPPFNKGRDFHATPESLTAGGSFQDRWSWKADVHQEWVDQIQDDRQPVWSVIDFARRTYGDDMGVFLAFLAVRLIEMRRVLREDGSIYLHCDPTASHYLKALMDGVFGRKQFRNEIG